MNIKIALVGNPNCGKTTLFNALTGSNQYVGNWPGVTVEKKEGLLKRHSDVIVTDLPGVYSLSPYTLEEVVARNYLIDEEPSVILNIIDGTSLERNLYLTTQLIELGIPVVIAINMMDIVRKNGDSINTDELSRALGCRVLEISALKSDGILDAAEAAIAAAVSGERVPHYHFSGEVEHAIAHIEEAAVHSFPEEKQRFYAVKIFERDENILKKLNISEEKLEHIEKDIREAEEALDDDAESIIINERYNYIDTIIKRCYKRKRLGRLSTSDKIDRIVTNRWAAIPIFAALMFLVYFISIGTVGNFTVDFMNDALFGSFAETYPDSFMAGWISVPEMLDMILLDQSGAPVIWDWLYSLIQDGVVGGVGAVLGFVPQMIILFLLLSLLEDCGYMSRVAFIMDKAFRKFGLSGKSFIPMLIASGCGVPGIMASRTIEQDRDRKITIMTTGFIPCGAKMPLIGLIAGSIFGDDPVASAMISVFAYFIGIAAVVISGTILKKLRVFAGNPAPFVMEMPAYHAPLAKNIFRTTWDRGWSFIKRAGTVIFAASVIIWTLNSLTFEGGFHYITDENGGASILEAMGHAIAWIFIPLGFGNWQSAVATILGLMAKEEIVGAFGTMAGSEAGIHSYVNGVFGADAFAAFSFMVFNLLCAPCVAAMGAIKREMNSGKWTAFAIGYMCVFAYATSFCIYQLGSLFTGESIWYEPIMGIIALAIICVAVYLMARRSPELKKSIK